MDKDIMVTFYRLVKKYESQLKGAEHYTDKDGDRRDYGGIHCGEVFEFCLNDVWVPARMEMGMDGGWYLVGLLGLMLDGLEVRQG